VPSFTASTPRHQRKTADPFGCFYLLFYTGFSVDERRIFVLLLRFGCPYAMTHRLNNDTPALNALKALRGAPISMGREVKFPVELQAGSRQISHSETYN